MHLLDFIAKANAKTQEEIVSFRREIARDLPDTYDRRFFDYRFHNPYFGYVEIQNDACRPFYMLTNNDDVIAQQYLWYGRNGYGPATVREWVRRAKRASVVFDVGAHTGLFSLLACAANPELEAVTAFEPLPRAHARIMENLIVNHMVSKVAVERIAVAGRDGERTLYVPGDEYQIALTSSCTAPDDSDMMHRQEPCAAMSLDTYIAERGIVPDLVKINVEGAEGDVLGGAGRLLQGRRTTFLVEIRAGTASALADAFSGYRLYVIDDAENTVLDYRGETMKESGVFLATPL